MPISSMNMLYSKQKKAIIWQATNKEKTKKKKPLYDVT